VWLPRTAHSEISAATSFSLRVVNVQYGAKVTMSMRDIKYDPTRTLVQMTAAKGALIARCFRSNREYLAASYLADGFVSGDGLDTIDGSPLFDSAHPYSELSPEDTYSNRLSGDQPIDPTALQNAMNLFAMMMASNGWERIDRMPKKCIANPTNYADVMLTLKGPMDYTTANNRLNTSSDYNIKPVFWNWFVPEPSVASDPDCPYPGFVLTTGEGLYFKTLEGFMTETDVDKDTGMFMLLANDDAAFACDDPTQLVGSLGG
jgi:hypothetical protein